MLTALALLLAGVSSEPESTSSFLKVEELLTMCAQDRERCMAFVEGASDMAKFIQATDVIPARFCTSPDVKLRKLTDDVVSFLRGHEEFVGQGAGGAVWVALTQTHGCARVPE